MNASPRRLSAATRSELAAALVANVPPPLRTLMVDLLAESFVDAYADRATARRPAALLAWVDRMCHVHADAPGVPLLFASACTTIGHFVGAHGTVAASRVPLRYLDDAIGPIVAKRRTRELPPATDRLDGIDASINALVQKLDRADPLTADHSRAVGAWCTRLARRLSFAEDQTVEIGRFGLIHDVGKITTPTEILHAPRKLTDDEFDVMRSHTTAGERLIREDDRLRGFMAAARSHHERLDGRGYPDRLPPSDISFEIRIVTVADCFNAMIGRRPYRASMSPAAALDELDRGCGTQFDRDVVAAMHDVVFELRARPRPGGTGAANHVV